jgi:hypothetical protein
VRQTVPVWHRRAFQIAAVVVSLYVIGTLVARRLGYRVGGDVPVRCRAGHVYTTLWIPGASLKSLRLGWARFQWCPVGGHWSLVTPLRDADLTDDDRVSAELHHDVRIP